MGGAKQQRADGPIALVAGLALNGAAIMLLFLLALLELASGPL